MATVNKKDPSKAISFMDMSQTSLERILYTGERTFVKALWAFSIRFLIASLIQFLLSLKRSLKPICSRISKEEPSLTLWIVNSWCAFFRSLFVVRAESPIVRIDAGRYHK